MADRAITGRLYQYLFTLVVLLVVLLVAFVLWRNSRSDIVAVPELVGRTLSDAESSASSVGWSVETTFVRVPDTARYEVVRVDPPSGQGLHNKGVLKLDVSLGEPLVSVNPEEFYSLPVEFATARLNQLGLKVSEPQSQDVHHEQVHKGYVVSVVMPEGVYELETGSSVGLMLSLGPDSRLIPDVPEDGSFETAKQLLADAGFVAVRREIELDSATQDLYQGSVIVFDPISGTEAKYGGTVAVLVLAGATWVELPTNMLGVEIEDAVDHLCAIGLHVKVIGESGTVISVKSASPEESQIRVKEELLSDGTVVEIKQEFLPYGATVELVRSDQDIANLDTGVDKC